MCAAAFDVEEVRVPAAPAVFADPYVLPYAWTLRLINNIPCNGSRDWTVQFFVDAQFAPLISQSQESSPSPATSRHAAGQARSAVDMQQHAVSSLSNHIGWLNGLIARTPNPKAWKQATDFNAVLRALLHFVHVTVKLHGLARIARSVTAAGADSAASASSSSPAAASSSGGWIETFTAELRRLMAECLRDFATVLNVDKSG